MTRLDTHIVDGGLAADVRLLHFVSRERQLSQTLGQRL